MPEVIVNPEAVARYRAIIDKYDHDKLVDEATAQHSKYLYLDADRERLRDVLHCIATGKCHGAWAMAELARKAMKPDTSLKRTDLPGETQ